MCSLCRNNLYISKPNIHKHKNSARCMLSYQNRLHSISINHQKSLEVQITNWNVLFRIQYVFSCTYTLIQNTWWLRSELKRIIYSLPKTYELRFDDFNCNALLRVTFIIVAHKTYVQGKRVNVKLLVCL